MRLGITKIKILWEMMHALLVEALLTASNAICAARSPIYRTENMNAEASTVCQNARHAEKRR